MVVVGGCKIITVGLVVVVADLVVVLVVGGGVVVKEAENVICNKISRFWKLLHIDLRWEWSFTTMLDKSLLQM